jgi:hypothetical protein
MDDDTLCQSSALSDDHDITLKKKLQQLSDQLDAVKKASEAVAREEGRANESVEGVKDASHDVDPAKSVIPSARRP